PAAGSHRAAPPGAEAGGRLARGEEAAQDALLDDRLPARRDALVVEGERAEPAGHRRVGGDVHALGAVAERAEVAGAQEARARVGGLGAVHAVELDRMADRLVQLEVHLVRVEDDRRPPGRTGIGAQEGRRLLGHARRLALEPERLHVLPAGLRAPAAVRARVAADLGHAVRGRDGVDPGAALDELL